MRVLVIDDESDICMMISRIFKSKGIVCDCAHSVAQGKAKSRNISYELFIIDINLPDGTGLDLISNIKEGDAKANIVTISAYDDAEIINRALALGARKFVKKPFSKSEILALV